MLTPGSTMRPIREAATDTRGVCSFYAMPKTAFAGAGHFDGYSFCTQLVPVHGSAPCAMVLQHSSSLPCTALAAPKQPGVWHNISLISKFSYTASAMLQNVKAKFTSQASTLSAAQRQGTGSSAISDSLLFPSQTHTLDQVAVHKPNAKSYYWQDMSGHVQGYPAVRIQHVAAETLARLASVLQPGSNFSGAASNRAQQVALWHTIGSGISHSTASSAVLQKTHNLAPRQLLAVTAARAQGTGSNAISAGAVCASVIGTMNPAAWSQAVPTGWHQQHATAMMSRGFCTATKAAPNKQEGGPDISLLSPRVQSLWDHASNAHLGSRVIKPYSNLHACWTCPKCPDGHSHNWRARIDDITRNQGCPLCSGRELCPHNSLARKAPHLIPDWDTAKNVDTPHDYTVSSNHRVHSKCLEGHQWQVGTQRRTNNKTGCPVCARSRPRQRLPTLTASTSQVMNLWHRTQNEEAGLDPSKLTCGSNLKAYFICSQCPQQQSHQWTAAIQNIVRGQGCPYCSSRKVCKCNSLETLRPDLAAEWCYVRNEATPSDYTSQSSKKVWWENSRRGRWKEGIDSRSPIPKPEVLR